MNMKRNRSAVAACLLCAGLVCLLPGCSARPGSQADEDARRCEAGDGEDCLAASAYLMVRHQDEQAYRTALLEDYRNDCWYNDNIDACLAVATMEHPQKGHALNDRGKVEIIRKACDQDAGSACAVLALMHTDGLHILRDVAQGRAYAQRACDLADGWGCALLGDAYESSDEVVEYDYGRAFQSYERACELADGWGCGRLGQAYETGQGVEQDYGRAFQSYERSCELAYGWGCGRLGQAYATGRGVEQDYGRARQSYERACELDDGWGCARLGTMYQDGQGVRADFAKAAAYYELACDGFEDRESCGLLGKLHEKGLGVKRDLGRAHEYYSRACDFFNKEICDADRALLQQAFELLEKKQQHP